MQSCIASDLYQYRIIKTVNIINTMTEREKEYPILRPEVKG